MRHFPRNLLVCLTVLVLAAAAFVSPFAPSALAGGSRDAAYVETEKAAPRKIVITGSEFLAKGKTITLTATVSPAGASQSVIWQSSDKKIATVDSEGRVKGKKTGVVRITARSAEDPSVKRNFDLLVLNKAVSRIQIANARKLDLNGQKSVTLKAKASPSGAAQTFTWKSSKPKVAKVSSEGVVTALKVGTAKITCTATDGSKTKATVTIRVVNTGADPTDTPTEEPGSGGKYYALVIANNYAGTGSSLDGTHNDARAMSGALKTLNQSWNVTTRYNLTANEMLAAIRSTFSGATAEDTCLFFYSGHGITSAYNAGALVGNDLNSLPPAELASTLDAACPGRVIVLLDSCGSGAMIDPTLKAAETAEEEEEEKEHADASASAFTHAIVDAFSSRNKSVTNKYGELISNRFSVLVASSAFHYSKDITRNGMSFGAFTYSLLRSMGCSYPHGSFDGGYMPADSDKNNRLTLYETYRGIRSVVSSNGWDSDGQSQNTQMSGSKDTVLFTR